MQEGILEVERGQKPFRRAQAVTRRQYNSRAREQHRARPQPHVARAKVRSRSRQVSSRVGAQDAGGTGGIGVQFHEIAIVGVEIP